MKSKRDLKVETTTVFKLKNDPPERKYQFIHLKETFGFVPDVICISKEEGHDKFRVSAIVPEKKNGVAEKWI